MAVVLRSTSESIPRPVGKRTNGRLPTIDRAAEEALLDAQLSLEADTNNFLAHVEAEFNRFALEFRHDEKSRTAVLQLARSLRSECHGHVNRIREIRVTLRNRSAQITSAARMTVVIRTAIAATLKHKRREPSDLLAPLFPHGEECSVVRH